MHSPNSSDNARVSSRPPDTLGSVFVAEYHNVALGRGPYYRTPDEFRSDLERLYKDGFRPVTVSQYVADRMPLPSGASPVVFTFDDSDPSQLKLKPDGSVDPTCAVGIWQAFAARHPDFPVHATFFVLPNMWDQPRFVSTKVALLRSLGCELANHTITHPVLRKLSDDRVEQEIGQAALNLQALGEPGPYSLAYPFGSTPKNKKLLNGFRFNGKDIRVKSAFLVGANPAPSPTDPHLSLYRIPRIQACKGPLGLNDWLDKEEQGEVKVYVQP